MAIQCRAKNPNSCRVHGTNGEYEKLQKAADLAARSGHVELYMNVRSQMDALQDEPEDQMDQQGGLPAAAIEAGASIHWSASGWQKVSNGVRKLALDEARTKLEVAAPYLIKGNVTTSAITAVAKHSWESRGNGSWNRAGMNERDALMRKAQRFLKAAEPHLKNHATESKTANHKIDILSESSVDAAASIHFQPEVWKTRLSEVMKDTYRKEARGMLASAAPHLQNGVITDDAINAAAKYGWESRGNGKWSKAGTEDRVTWLLTSKRLLSAALRQ
jgi:hypothetical protein